MIDETPIQKALKDILEARAFEKLDAYSDQQEWQAMTQEERELLAHIFTSAGEDGLKSDASVTEAKKAFQSASLLSPLNPTIWYRRASALLGQGQPALLEEASLCLDKAVTLDPSFFDAWYAWGNLLMFRGSLTGETHYFEMAEERFKKACALIEETEPRPEFFWHYGLSWFTIGRHSGEAHDYHMAIRYFKKAKSQGLENGEFLNDFANAYVTLALLTSCQEMLCEAIELYLRSLEIDKDTHEAPNRYCNLGCCYQYLFEITHELSFFNQAQTCFSSAVQLKGDFFQGWTAWGDVLLFASKLWQNAVYLKDSVEKFSRAGEFSQESPFLLSRWAEALARLGYYQDELNQIVEAEKLANRALELAPHDSEAWFASTFALYYLGRYFSDEKSLIIASEKAQQGLLLHQQHSELWHVLAVTKFCLSEIQEDGSKSLEEALFCFHQAASGEFSRIGCFWYDWGNAYLYVAEITHDPKYAQEAIDKFEQAILLQEQANSEWLLAYASGLDLLGDLTDDELSYERAIQILTYLTTLEPENTSARYQLALSMSHLGELTSDISAYEKAIELLQKVVEEEPEDEHAWNDLGLAFMNMAELLDVPSADEPFKKSLYEAALQYFMKAVYLGNQYVLYYIACLYSLKGNLDVAIEYLEKAFENNTLPPFEDVMEDEWLQALRGTPHFERFLKRLAMQQNDV